MRAINILVTGGGTAGSFQIRGEQLGRAIGATVLARAVDFDQFDAVVVVKRPPAGTFEAIHRAGVPLIWDVVDAWPQPAGNQTGKEGCMAWLADQMRIVNPAAVVAATKAMAADIKALRPGLPVLALPHHARPGLDPNPIRQEVKTIGYEGAEHYINSWRLAIDVECRRRGWRFVVNPESLVELDIVLALRGSTGYAPRNWKSGVKLANAQGSGTPFIGCGEAGYLENAVPGCERFADTDIELRRAFDELTPVAERRRVSARMQAAAPTLESVASTYQDWLREVIGK